tara:strand:- start:17 stop:256 length:240 start_codon:yes stop_codon:yes gene_type:complete
MRKREMDKKNTISIDGTEIDYEELEDKQKYMVNQIKDLNIKIANAEFVLDQLRIAQNSFTNLLVQSLKEESDDSDKDNA